MPPELGCVVVVVVMTLQLALLLALVDGVVAATC